MLQSTGSQRVGHSLATEQQQAMLLDLPWAHTTENLPYCETLVGTAHV